MNNKRPIHTVFSRQNLSLHKSAHAPQPGHIAPPFKRRPDKRLIAAAIVVLVLLVFGIGSCVASPHQLPKDEFVTDKTYNWDNLHNNDGRYSYVENGTVKSRVGIDVSEHQHYVDWHAVVNDGIEFAFIRVGNRGTSEGAIMADEYYNYNIDAAIAAGLDVGVYFFSQSVTEEEAIEEANYVLEKIRGENLTYPVVYDHEPIPGTSSRADGLSVEQMTANARAFCETIEDAGYNVMIYGNSRDLNRYNLSELSEWGVWLARYETSTPDRSSGFSIWQYTNSGRVDGIDTAVDLNIHFLP